MATIDIDKWNKYLNEVTQRNQTLFIIFIVLSIIQAVYVVILIYIALSLLKLVGETAINKISNMRTKVQEITPESYEEAQSKKKSLKLLTRLGNKFKRKERIPKELTIPASPGKLRRAFQGIKSYFNKKIQSTEENLDTVDELMDEPIIQSSQEMRSEINTLRKQLQQKQQDFDKFYKQVKGCYEKKSKFGANILDKLNDYLHRTKEILESDDDETKPLKIKINFYIYILYLIISGIPTTIIFAYMIKIILLIRESDGFNRKSKNIIDNLTGDIDQNQINILQESLRKQMECSDLTFKFSIGIIGFIISLFVFILILSVLYITPQNNSGFGLNYPTTIVHNFIVDLFKFTLNPKKSVFIFAISFVLLIYTTSASVDIKKLIKDMETELPKF